jgi:hypothetical protein
MIFADHSANIIDMEVQISENGTDWEEIVGSWDSGWFNTWGQYDFAEPRMVYAMRIRVRTDTTMYVYIYEMQMRTTHENETSLFAQGADERTFRCAIANYHASDTYYVGYTHALYIKDFDAITTWSDEDGNGGEVSQSQSFNYANDGETLLKWGQAYLPTVSYPPTTYKLQAALLNEVNANFAFEELQLGSIVSVMHEDLGITVSARVQKIQQSRLDITPAEATIEISTLIKTLADTIRTIWNKI